MSKKWFKRRKRLFEILEVGTDVDRVSRAYDFAYRRPSFSLYEDAFV